MAGIRPSPSDVIPAQAGIQVDLGARLVFKFKGRASTRPVGERVTFLTPGILPSAALPPASLFAPLLRRSACAKKGNQRNTPPAARLPGILPFRSARVLRGSLDVRPCTFSERAHIVCALLRTFPTHPCRASGGPDSAASCRRSQDSLLRGASAFLEVVQGCTDSWINGAVRGAEHRRLCRKCPKGRGDGSPRLRSSTCDGRDAGGRATQGAVAEMYCLSNPAKPRSTGNFDSQDANQNTASGA